MKISFCHYYSLSHGGGGERIVTDAANFLSSRGHQVSVHCLPFRRRRNLFHLDHEVLYCEKLLHRFSADVSYHIYAPLLPYLFLCSAPRVAGLHSALVSDLCYDPLDFLRQGPFVSGAYAFQKSLGKYALARFDAVHAVTQIGVPLKHRRTYTIPNWVDCSVTNESLKTKHEKGKTFKVLFAGKPQYVKGFDIFLALSEIIEDEDIEFVSTYAPPSANQNSKVRFLGAIPHSEMPQLFSKVGVLLHPVRQETFGLVILESLASGTPVVTTPISSHISLKLPLRYAANLRDFVREIRLVYSIWKEDYDAYLRLAKEGAGAVRLYDRTIVLPRFEDMLKEVAERSSAPPKSQG
jgi:glycosyltransferase involved in cell wall biosynthesis